MTWWLSGTSGRRLATLAIAAWLALGAGLAAHAQTNQPSGQRGGSGLPPGPGNPLAKLQKQLSALQARFGPALVWINHLDFVSGDASVVTSVEVNGLSGLIIESTSAGDVVVERGLQVPPGYLVAGVRLCYELSSPDSLLTRITVSQLQNPPGTVDLELDDATTDLSDPGPICVDSASADPAIDPAGGALRLILHAHIDSAADQIRLRAVGLHLEPSGP